MDSTFTGYWSNKIKSSYDGSEWTDGAGRSFASQEIPDITKSLAKLGQVGDSITQFMKNAEELLRS